MKDSTIYLDTAAAGVLSEQTLEASRKYDYELTKSPSRAFFSFLEDDYPRVKKRTSDFCGVDPDQLAFIPNFSYGLTAMLPSLQKKHSRVLLLENDYPSLTLPFQLHGFNTFWLPSQDGFSWNLNELEDAITKHNTEILAISHVQYLTGAKLDIEKIAAICKRTGVLLIIDATQSLGAIPFHFENSGIDVLITSNYKWMNAGFGSGLMCFRKGFFDDYPPTIGGFGSFKHVEGDWQYVPGSASYQPGHFNFGNLLGLEQAINEKNKLSLVSIQKHNKNLAAYFIGELVKTNYKILGPENMESRSSIICLEADQSAHKRLEKAGIRCTFRNNSLRVAFHFTNTKPDVDAALEVLKST